ncbi:MAG: 3-oxoacyl-ACP reductase [marine bacterium B5-7]|nr:MAG: 3-oxoacyl-ACP reductase [marine bacterium B5-7]
MNLDLDGKRALVCGSSQGLGRACAIQFARMGASVTLFSRNRDKLEAVASELDKSPKQTHHVLVADFTDTDAVRKAVDDHVNTTGPFEILINNSGGPPPGSALDADVSDYMVAVNMHLLTFQHLVQALVPGMRETGYGRIINVISTSVKQPIAGLGVSNTVRGAVANWSKTLAGELGPYGITVNNLLPGATETDRLETIMGNRAKRENTTLEAIADADKQKIPMRRFARPEEFADAAAFLASPSAGYITGINLPVDGGRTLCL